MAKEVKLVVRGLRRDMPDIKKLAHAIVQAVLDAAADQAAASPAGDTDTGTEEGDG